MSSPLLRSLITVNAPYAAMFAFFSILPLLIVKKLGWYPEAARLSSWIILFFVSGLYYAIFRSPNIIGFLFDLFTTRIESSGFFSVLYGSMAFAGIFILFYSSMSFISARKDNIFQLRVDPKSFLIWSITYLLYLNAMTSIINPVFRRPI
jgi:hypothetical protein